MYNQTVFSQSDPLPDTLGYFFQQLLQGNILLFSEIQQLIRQPESIKNLARIKELLQDPSKDQNYKRLQPAIKKCGAYINLGDGEISTALHFAVIFDRLDYIKLLLTNRANINAIDHHDCTPLHIATLSLDSYPNFPAIQILLAHKPDLNICSKQGETFLHFLAKCMPENITDENEEVMKKILQDANLDTCIKNKGGATPLQLAIENQVASFVLLFFLYANKEQIAKQINAAITTAIEKNSIDCLIIIHEMWKELPIKEKNLEEIFSQDNFCLLDTLLYKKIINFNWCTKNNQTLLHMAARYNAIKCLKLLLTACDIAINSQDDSGATALHYAAANGCNEVVTILLENKINPIIVNKNNLTALDIAQQKIKSATQTKNQQYQQCIGLLKNHTSASPILASSNKNNPASEANLYEAARQRDNKLLITLLSRLSTKEIMIPDGNGYTALDYAAKNDDVVNVSILMNCVDGADKEKIYNYQINALNNASQANSNDAFELIFNKLTRANPSDEQLQTIKKYIKVIEDKQTEIKPLPENLTQKQLTQLLQQAVNNLDNTLLKQCLKRGIAQLADIKGSTLFLNLFQVKGDTVKRIACLQSFLLSQQATLYLNQTNSQNQTALHLAVILGDTDILQILLSSKKIKNINAVDDNGNTPLHLAAATGNTAITKLLIQHGLDKTTLNKNKQTAHDIAQASKKNNPTSLTTENFNALLKILEVNLADKSINELVNFIEGKSKKGPAKKNHKQKPKNKKSAIIVSLNENSPFLSESKISNSKDNHLSNAQVNLDKQTTDEKNIPKATDGEVKTSSELSPIILSTNRNTAQSNQQVTSLQFFSVSPEKTVQNSQDKKLANQKPSEVITQVTVTKIKTSQQLTVENKSVNKNHTTLVTAKPNAEKNINSNHFSADNSKPKQSLIYVPKKPAPLLNTNTISAYPQPASNNLATQSAVETQNKPSNKKQLHEITNLPTRFNPIKPEPSANLYAKKIPANQTATPAENSTQQIINTLQIHEDKNKENALKTIDGTNYGLPGKYLPSELIELTKLFSQYQCQTLLIGSAFSSLALIGTQHLQAPQKINDYDLIIVGNLTIDKIIELIEKNFSTKCSLQGTAPLQSIALSINNIKIDIVQRSCKTPSDLQTTLIEDAKTRAPNAHSIAYDLQTNKIYGNEDDLVFFDQHTIYAGKNPLALFSTDESRIIRCLRASYKCNFALAKNLRETLSNLQDEISHGKFPHRTFYQLVKLFEDIGDTEKTLSFLEENLLKEKPSLLKFSPYNFNFLKTHLISYFPQNFELNYWLSKANTLVQNFAEKNNLVSMPIQNRCLSKDNYHVICLLLFAGINIQQLRKILSATPDLSLSQTSTSFIPSKLPPADNQNQQSHSFIPSNCYANFFPTVGLPMSSPGFNGYNPYFVTQYPCHYFPTFPPVIYNNSNMPTPYVGLTEAVNPTNHL